MGGQGFERDRWHCYQGLRLSQLEVLLRLCHSGPINGGWGAPKKPSLLSNPGRERFFSSFKTQVFCYVVLLSFNEKASGRQTQVVMVSPKILIALETWFMKSSKDWGGQPTLLGVSSSLWKQLFNLMAPKRGSWADYGTPQILQRSRKTAEVARPLQATDAAKKGGQRLNTPHPGRHVVEDVAHMRGNSCSRMQKAWLINMQYRRLGQPSNSIVGI